MLESILITVIANDRPGIVQTLSDLIKQHQGSWQESSLSHLGGEFAGLIRITIDKSQEAQLLAALGELKDQGIDVYHRSAPISETNKTMSTRLGVTGNDRQGIVEEIAKVLAQHNVNVEKLESYCEPAPMAGNVLFVAKLEVCLPDTMSETDLQEALESLSDDLMVEYAN